MFRKFLIINLLLLGLSSLFAQVTPETQGYRDDEYGDIQYRREGVMDGNLVRTLFYNNGEVGQWPYSPSGEWPKGTGHNYLDGVALLITTELKTEGGTVHPLQTSYREWMDEDPLTGRIWGLEPVPGYSNPESEYPAMSTDTSTWPAMWPRALPEITPEWDGLWYGYFGRGVKNSDFETFFVMDDSQDGEFARPPYNYYPIAADPDRKGLGLRVEVRGFQWSHVLAEDIIFWHYDIVNIADNDYLKTYFGFYTDTGVGGQADNADDNASYDTKLDIAYAFDDDGRGAPGQWKTGYYGYAYLESPGNPFNGVDDDEDGMIDEKRDDGIDNDGDWVGYADLNGNGKWDADQNEPLNHDVGADGVGPFDEQYIAPDEGEGDGVPTLGEPEFDKTDKDESDQIGLTSLSIYRLGDGGTGGGWPKDDEQMWVRMQKTNFDTSLQRANISMVFASGQFELRSNLRERFSMALVFGEDLDDITFNKETVQQIYNSNYNFAKPPITPTLTAVPGNKKVYLYWDSKAEESRDAFLGYEQDDPTLGAKKDFEGYLIYRSREPEFNDIKNITDSKGQKKYYEPIAQFDLKDGIKGPDPVGIRGASFWRGDDTGLQHSYVDEDVENGVEYYYAVVSYDMGDPDFGSQGLTPSECSKNIRFDFSGNLLSLERNCAIITPNAPAIGYKAPEINGDLNNPVEGDGTGNINVNLLNPSGIRENASYKVEFESDDAEYNYETIRYSVLRTYEGSTDTLFTLDSTNIGQGLFSTPFDGMTMEVINDTEVNVIDSLTGWVKGSSNMNISVVPDSRAPAKDVKWPSDYELKFYAEPQDTTPFNNIPINFTVLNVTSGKFVTAELFEDATTEMNQLSPGDRIVIIEYPEGSGPNGWKLTWQINYDPPPGQGYQPIGPEPGDIFRISTTKPFRDGDYFEFTTRASGVDNEMAKNSLDKINVVPNPYISSARWEKRNLNQSGRGQRKIDFTNLPPSCTVRIYTVAGQLIKTLYKDDSLLDGSLSWNLVTDDGMDLAYGLYIFHVDAPGVGTHIGRFAIIK